MLPTAERVRVEVTARRPVDARERTSITEFLRAIEALQSPFDEHANPTHITGSAIITGPRGVVLHRHKRLGIWLQPGGHIDPGEDPPDAARREASEETGLPLELVSRAIVHVDVHPGPRGHRHLDVRYLIASEDVEPAPPPEESQDVRWFSWAEAIAGCEPGLEGALRALQPGDPVLRRATPDDAGQMAHVFLRSRTFATPTIPNLHDAPDVTGWITGRIERDEAWVADLDGVVVGEMILSHESVPAFLDHLYLDPAWMGRGLGERLLERAGRSLQLWTHEVNGGARRFYERHGFTVAETTDGATNEERLPDVRYVRS